MFVDTNVLVQAHFKKAPNHALAHQQVETALERGGTPCISRQILREYLATVTRPQSWSPPITMKKAWKQVANLKAAFRILEDGSKVTDKLEELCQKVCIGGRQIHDANIVATMLVHEEYRLLTFNQKDFNRYKKYITLI